MQDSSSNENIKKTIATFAQAGDEYNCEQLDTVLHLDYRMVLNQLFRQSGVNIMSKSDYIDKVRNHTFGGDKREIEFHNLIVNGNSAMANVFFKGEKMQFSSLITLVKEEDEQWRMIQEVPVIA